MSYDDEEPTIDPDRLRIAHELGDKLIPVAQKLGLYQQSFRIGAAGEGSEATMVLIVDFLPGEIAWEDRTLNPERHTIEEEFKAIADQSDDDRFEEYRANLERKLTEGPDEAPQN